MTTGDTAAATVYERLLSDRMVGAATLFDVWKSLPPRDVPDDPAAGVGPAAAEPFVARGGRGWWLP